MRGRRHSRPRPDGVRGRRPPKTWSPDSVAGPARPRRLRADRTAAAGRHGRRLAGLQVPATLRRREDDRVRVRRLRRLLGHRDRPAHRVPGPAHRRHARQRHRRLVALHRLLVDGGVGPGGRLAEAADRSGEQPRARRQRCLRRVPDGGRRVPAGRRRRPQGPAVTIGRAGAARVGRRPGGGIARGADTWAPQAPAPSLSAPRRSTSWRRCWWMGSAVRRLSSAIPTSATRARRRRRIRRRPHLPLDCYTQPDCDTQPDVGATDDPGPHTRWVDASDRVTARVPAREAQAPGATVRPLRSYGLVLGATLALS